MTPRKAKADRQPGRQGDVIWSFLRVGGPFNIAMPMSCTPWTGTPIRWEALGGLGNLHILFIKKCLFICLRQVLAVAHGILYHALIYDNRNCCSGSFPVAKLCLPSTWGAELSDKSQCKEAGLKFCMGSQEESSLFCLPIDENLAKLDGATAFKKRIVSFRRGRKSYSSRLYNIRKACFYLFYFLFF